MTRLGVKATTLKAKAKDLASKAKAKDDVKANVRFAVQSKLQNTDVYCRAGND